MGLLRQTTRYRPIVLAAAAFAIGVGAGGSAWSAPALFSAAVVLAGCYIGIRHSALCLAAILAAFAGAGALRQWVQLNPGPRDIALHAGHYVELTGELATEPDIRDRFARATVRALTVSTDGSVVRRCNGCVLARLVVTPGVRMVGYGDRVVLRGPLELLSEPGNVGSGINPDTLRRQGIFCTMLCRHAGSWRRIRGPTDPAYVLASRILGLRHSLERVFRRYVSAERAAFLTGVVLGGRASLTPEATEAFRISGLLHITAASGANVAIIVGLVFFVLRQFRPGAGTRAYACIVAACLYSIAAGNEPAVVRAAVMACVFMGAPLFDRDKDAPCALAAAALVGLAYDPGNLLDVGFQLSFVIVAMTIAFWPMWEALLTRWLPWSTELPQPLRTARSAERGALSVCVLSLIAGAASAPLTAQTFHSVAVLGVVSNALAAPAVSIMMPAALAGWLLGIVVPPLGGLICLWLLNPLAGWVLEVARGISAIPFAAVNLPSPGWVVVAALYLAMGWAAYAARKAMHGQRYP
jgi:competence protein ComEC